MSRLLPLLVIALATTGCGLKGDLYLPKPKSPSAPAQTQEPQPSDESDPLPTDPDPDKEPGVDRPASEPPVTP